MGDSCAEGFPAGTKKAVRPEDLIGRPLMASGRGLVQNELANWFGEYADQIDIFSTHNLLYNTAMMVDKGAGEALTLRLESSYDNLCFVPLSPAWKPVRCWHGRKTRCFRRQRRHLSGM